MHMHNVLVQYCNFATTMTALTALLGEAGVAKQSTLKNRLTFDLVITNPNGTTDFNVTIKE